MTAIVVSQMSFDNAQFGPGHVLEMTAAEGNADIGDSLSVSKSVSLLGRNSVGGSAKAVFTFDADDTDYVWPERGFWRVTVEALEEGDL